MSWNDRVGWTEWCVCTECGKVASYLSMWKQSFAPKSCHKGQVIYGFKREKDALGYLHNKAVRKRTILVGAKKE